MKSCSTEPNDEDENLPRVKRSLEPNNNTRNILSHSNLLQNINKNLKSIFDEVVVHKTAHNNHNNNKPNLQKFTHKIDTQCDDTINGQYLSLVKFKENKTNGEVSILKPFNDIITNFEPKIQFPILRERKFFKSGESLDVQTSRIPLQQNDQTIPTTLRRKPLSLSRFISVKSEIKRKQDSDLPGANHSAKENHTQPFNTEIKDNLSIESSIKPNKFLLKKRPSALKLSLSSNSETTTATKRSAEDFITEFSNVSESFKRPKIPKMSLYDRRYQSDDRPVSNGYLPPRNNDENYYSMSTNSNSSSSHQPTMSTLCNIGNTCYLNSVVYTLRFAPLFLHNLHHLIDDLSSIQQNIGKHRAKSSSLGRNIPGLPMENVRSWSSKDLASLESYSTDVSTQKSTQQLATEKLHELYQNLHRNEIVEATEPFHADTFLHAIQDVSSIFEGNQQQDAHEFLMCVLDSIRETCQSLIKAISDCPDALLNGNISLPEESELNISSIKDQPVQSHHSNSSNSSSISNSTTNLIKNAFFTRKSKRKDDSKNSKNLRHQSSLKENPIPEPETPKSFAEGLPSPVDATESLNNSKSKLSSATTTPDDEFIGKDKERLAEKIKKMGLDFFTQDFEGITVATTKCLSCETVTEQRETMIDIAVPVPISGYDNTDYTEKSNSFIQNSCITREYFRGENKYRCEQCIGYTEAIRSISYEVLPRLLVIQLSRFSGGMEKINSYIPTPFTLQCFCAKCCELGDSNKLHIYRLYSVITHVGATMSVGHYIAYTCSLDYATEYINCSKDKRRQQTQASGQNGGKSLGSSSTGAEGSSNGVEKNVGLMKKIIFGRNKASSSGDMSKNVKNINGLTSKAITNGIDKLNMNTTCSSINCCGIRLKNNLHHGNGMNGTCANGGYNTNLVDDNQQQQQPNVNGGTATASNSNSSLGGNSTSYGSSYPSGYGTTGRNKTATEPIWYMCDDDKIKTMTQREFEELLSPNRKITITPYLLFYARSDLQ